MKILKKKPDYCKKCGNDKNYTHERDGSQMCWCRDEEGSNETPSPEVRNDKIP